MNTDNFLGADLSRAPFSHQTYRGRDFRGAQFKRVKILSAAFLDCTLGVTDWSRADLAGVSFAGSNLDGANFRCATLCNVDFRGASLIGADFERANIEACSFDLAVLRRTRFVKARAAQVTMRGADLMYVRATQRFMQGLGVKAPSSVRASTEETRAVSQRRYWAEKRFLDIVSHPRILTTLGIPKLTLEVFNAWKREYIRLSGGRRDYPREKMTLETYFQTFGTDVLVGTYPDDGPSA